ncbi:MAG: type II secretion system F family protein [Candidatus Omnitrophica bacterium]|nr:type II secretion system F family protein [Candidatus Omnitrophota bacterium]
MEIFLFLFIFFAVFIITYIISESIVPMLLDFYQKMHERRTQQFSAQLEESFLFWEKRKIFLISFLPLVFAGAAFVLIARNPIVLSAGFVAGLIAPQVILRIARAQRLKKFRGQLIDTLRILSSSIRAGLSFVQAIEVLCEEMPAPVSQEFNLILKENRLGVSLEESLKNLRERVPIDEVNLLVTSILIARESGGELPHVLARLVDTIRSNIKLKEKIATLTLQGKLQGIIMMFLPFVFTYIIYRQNPEHFDVMLSTVTGKKLLMTAVGLQIVGMFLIKKISTIKM